ncbi:MAG: hypothetical protein WKF83_11150 [Nocardioidaceae bacterium]
MELRDNGQLVIALGEAWRRTPAGGVRSGCCPVLWWPICPAPSYWTGWASRGQNLPMEGPNLRIEGPEPADGGEGMH